MKRTIFFIPWHIALMPHSNYFHKTNEARDEKRETNLETKKLK